MFGLDKAYKSVNTRARDSRSGFEFDGEDCEIIFKHDVAGKITFLNKAGELISGYSRQEACGMNIAQVVAPEFAVSMHDCVAGNSSKILGTVYEIDIIAKDGRRIALEVSTQAIARKGQPLEIEGIALPSVLRDLSRRPKRLRCLDEDFCLAG
ncbi:MAG TPA: PAS domain S-box protein [Pyrinomonadaceae bacterium]|nr:PAS domain S-box protein [Pyrinomonadaceae bacterium]